MIIAMKHLWNERGQVIISVRLSQANSSVFVIFLGLHDERKIIMLI